MNGFEDEMCRAAAHSLFFSLDSLKAFHFSHLNLSDRLIASMAELNLNQQKWLIGRAGYYLKFELNTIALERQLQELDVLQAEYQIENMFILKGSPRSLMRRLFGMHPTEFARRREILDLQGVSIGRPPKCDEAMEHTLWSLWQELEELDPRQRFLALADQTELDLHIIWGALKDYIDI